MSAPGCLLVGCGNVGSGVVRLWPEHAGGARLRTLAVRDPHKHREVDLARFHVTADALAAAHDPRIAVVIEATSDTRLAHALGLASLRSGRSFVTASKALVAAHGEELEQAASASGVTFGYEAAVGGALPVVALLRLGLSPGPVDGFEAVLNGTCNFVLSRLGEGASFEASVRAAQRAGFAEEDSTRDTSGRDTALKLVILARLCGVSLAPAQVPTRGIAGIDHGDVAFGRAHGWSLKLVARFRRTPAAADVGPAFVDARSMLAQPRDEENAVVLDAGARGRITLVGPGAGSLPTAAAVLADVRAALCGAPSAMAHAKPVTLAIPAGARRHYLRLKLPFGARSASRELLAALATAGVGTEVVASDRPGGAQVVTRAIPDEVITRVLATLREDEVVHVPVHHLQAQAVAATEAPAMEVIAG